LRRPVLISHLAEMVQARTFQAAVGLEQEQFLVGFNGILDVSRALQQHAQEGIRWCIVGHQGNGLAARQNGCRSITLLSQERGPLYQPVSTTFVDATSRLIVSYSCTIFRHHSNYPFNTAGRLHLDFAVASLPHCISADAA